MEVTTLKGNELLRGNAKQGGAPDRADTQIEFKIFRQHDRTFLLYRLSEPEQTFSSSTGMQ